VLSPALCWPSWRSAYPTGRITASEPIAAAVRSVFRSVHVCVCSVPVSSVEITADFTSAGHSYMNVGSRLTTVTSNIGDRSENVWKKSRRSGRTDGSAIASQQNGRDLMAVLSNSHVKSRHWPP